MDVEYHLGLRRGVGLEGAIQVANEVPVKADVERSAERGAFARVRVPRSDRGHIADCLEIRKTLENRGCAWREVARGWARFVHAGAIGGWELARYRAIEGTAIAVEIGRGSADVRGRLEVDPGNRNAPIHTRHAAISVSFDGGTQRDWGIHFVGGALVHSRVAHGRGVRRVRSNIALLLDWKRDITIHGPVRVDSQARRGATPYRSQQQGNHHGRSELRPVHGPPDTLQWYHGWSARHLPRRRGGFVEAAGGVYQEERGRRADLVGGGCEILLGEGETSGVPRQQLIEQRLEVSRPDGSVWVARREPASATNSVLYSETDRLGTYHVHAVGPDGTVSARPEQDFVVNLDTRESNPARLDPALRPDRIAVASPGGKPPKHRVELWHTLAAVMIALLLCESALTLRRRRV